MSSRRPLHCLLLLFATLCPPALAADKPADKPADPSALLPRHSKWSGNQVPDKARGIGHVHTCSFFVRERDGDSFAGVYWVQSADANTGIRIEGTISKKGLINAHPTKVVAGDVDRSVLQQTWTGQVTDTKLGFQWHPKDGGTTTALMDLDKPQHAKPH